MNPIRIARLLPLALALTVPLAHAAGDDDRQGIDKVNGSITAESGTAYGDLETVNGSIHLNDGARAEDASTVNGSIKAGNDVQVQDVETVNGSIRFGTGARIGGGLQTVNGGIFVDSNGQVAEDIGTVNGGIGVVRTEVGGGIETVGGDITVGIGSHVKGGVHVDKPGNNWLPITIGTQRVPHIVIGPHASVDGPLRFEREVKLYVHSTARIGPVTGAKPIAFSANTAPED